MNMVSLLYSPICGYRGLFHWQLLVISLIWYCEVKLCKNYATNKECWVWMDKQITPSNQRIWYCECHPPPHTLDIDDSGGNISCSLSDVAECSTIFDKNTPSSEFLPDNNTEYTSGDTWIFSQLHPPLLINEHKHPFGIKNPKFQCFLNSVLQLIFSVFRNNSYTSPFNSSTEVTLLKCLFHTAHNACNSKDVDALKFQLVHHDTFYNGQHQQDST